MLSIQSTLALLFFENQSKDIKQLIVFSFALIFWRFIFSSFFVFNKEMYTNLIKLQWHAAVLIRSLLTIGTQSTFIYVTTSEHSNYSWPILNCTLLFSGFLAQLTLKENSTKREFLAILLCTLIAIFSTLQTIKN